MKGVTVSRATSHKQTAVAGAAVFAAPAETIDSISAARRFFHSNRRPIYSFSATDFNLAGMEEWIGNFTHVCQIDSYDGRHPHVLVPPEREHEPFADIADVNNYLLRHKDVIAHIRRRGGSPVGVFLQFDEETEALCAELGMDVWFPEASLRARCDSKVETVRLGNRAGVPSVPNVLGRVRSYRQLRRLASTAGLRGDLVVQLPYGDSGHTTFFISNRDDFEHHASAIAAESEVKVMKRIDPLGATLEACVTRCGTIAGPLLTELVGHPELTPYPGGWAGNELLSGAFNAEQCATARLYAERMGAQLMSEGYRGYFDLDFLVDRRNGELFLGELNPRLCGASPLTNNAAFAHADVPLFLFHLLEFADVDLDLDVEALNDRWADPRSIDSWSSLVLKSTDARIERVTAAPQSGLWRLDGGAARYRRFDYRRGAVEDESDGLFLRITGPGAWRCEGADLGILITRGRLMDDHFELTDRAHAWIDGLSTQYASRPLASAGMVAAWSKSPPLAKGDARGPAVTKGDAGRAVVTKGDSTATTSRPVTKTTPKTKATAKTKVTPKAKTTEQVAPPAEPAPRAALAAVKPATRAKPDGTRTARPVVVAREEPTKATPGVQAAAPKAKSKPQEDPA